MTSIVLPVLREAGIRVFLSVLDLAVITDLPSPHITTLPPEGAIMCGFRTDEGDRLVLDIGALYVTLKGDSLVDTLASY